MMALDMCPPVVAQASALRTRLRRRRSALRPGRRAKRRPPRRPPRRVRWAAVLGRPQSLWTPRRVPRRSSRTLACRCGLQAVPSSTSNVVSLSAQGASSWAEGRHWQLALAAARAIQGWRRCHALNLVTGSIDRMLPDESSRCVHEPAVPAGRGGTSGAAKRAGHCGWPGKCRSRGAGGAGGGRTATARLGRPAAAAQPHAGGAEPPAEPRRRAGALASQPRRLWRRAAGVVSCCAIWAAAKHDLMTACTVCVSILKRPPRTSHACCVLHMDYLVGSRFPEPPTGAVSQM